jgi:hypothetical protein
VDEVRCIFREPFGDGSSRLPRDLTPTARLLNEVMRRTLLPRMGYREGLTRMQQYVLSHLASQTPFDIWDLLLCEIEDTIAEGFRGHRQLPYAHWISQLIIGAIEGARRVRDPLLRGELTGSPTSFPVYHMRPLHGVERPAAYQTRRTAPVTATEQEQDTVVESLAEAELAGLEGQTDDPVLDDVSSDSSDQDFVPVRELPPRRHDHEAGSSSSRTDPALLAILDRIQVSQDRQAQETATAL